MKNNTFDTSANLLFDISRLDAPFPRLLGMSRLYQDEGIFLRSVLLNHIPSSLKNKIHFDMSGPFNRGYIFDHCYNIARGVDDFFRKRGNAPILDKPYNHKLQEKLAFNFVYFKDSSLLKALWGNTKGTENKELAFDSLADVGEFIDSLSAEAVFVVVGDDYTYIDPEFERAYPGMLKEGNPFHDKFMETVHPAKTFPVSVEVHLAMAKTFLDIIESEGTARLDDCLVEWLANALKEGHVKSEDLGLDGKELIQSEGRWFFAKQV